MSNSQLLSVLCGTAVALTVSCAGLAWVIREYRRRRDAKLAAAGRTRVWPKGVDMPGLPDLRKREDVYKFFAEQVKLGEALLANRDEKAAVHLAYAVAVQGNYTQMLACCRQILPEEMYQAMITKLHQIAPIYID